MQIIPAINCPDFECVKEKIKKTQVLFTLTRQSKQNWVQLDIADGKFTQYDKGDSNFLISATKALKRLRCYLRQAPELLLSGKKLQEINRLCSTGFTPHKTWNNPDELSLLTSHIPPLNFEIHLMVLNPEQAIDDWVNAGAKRIIIHLEAIKNLKLITNNLKTCELGLAINPDTSVQKLTPYLKEKSIRFVQVLAVKPGLAGQEFEPKVLEKIKFLKENFPDITIEVDGGINKDTAKLCKDAGADILVSASYIWDNPDPKSVFLELANV